jgi:hypothetical protein
VRFALRNRVCRVGELLRSLYAGQIWSNGHRQARTAIMNDVLR